MARPRVLPKTDVDLSKIPVGGVYNLATLRQVGPWLREEVKNELSATAVNENKKQMRIGNDPTSVVVDIRAREIGETERRALATASNRTRFFRNADKRITFFYTSPHELAQAVTFAWNTLMKLTRRLTGRGQSTYYTWCEDRDSPNRNARCGTLATTVSWIEAAATSNIAVHILGPTTEYRRKLIYNPPGKQQQKWVPLRDAFSSGPAIDRLHFPDASKIGGRRETIRVRRNRSRSTRGLAQGQVNKAIQEVTKQRVRRTFKGVWVGYHFVRSREPLGHKYGRNVPRLYLSPLRSGRRPR